MSALRTTRRDPWFVPLLALDAVAALAMAVAAWAALLYAADAVNLAGDEQLAQRIFYFHMGCNITATLGFLVSVVGSIGYLVTRKLAWDRWAQAGVEVGTIFGIGTLVTGSIWAKPTWNTYWTWDPRLTTAAITILIYVAYILFRNGIENPYTRARFASIYAVFAFLSVPLTYYSARIFRSIHPVVFDGSNAEAQGDFGIGPSMQQALSLAMIAFTILFVTLLINRVRQLSLEARIEELREDLNL
ncbi:MAG: cytochrome C assembly protein [Caldilineae bacterium]|nr:MAG: cytochrome C assembly protein [Caldilineae bacterium]